MCCIKHIVKLQYDANKEVEAGKKHNSTRNVVFAVFTKTLCPAGICHCLHLQGSSPHSFITPSLLLSTGQHHAFHLCSKQLKQWDVLLPHNAEKQRQHYRCTYSIREGEAFTSLLYKLFISLFTHKKKC